jgi:hypothetical protein
LSGFTDDIVVEFADLPRIKGKAELERILKARLARQKGYRLEKTLRCGRSHNRGQLDCRLGRRYDR